MNGKIEIPLSKLKLALLFLGSLAFVVISIFFILGDAPLFIQSVGGIAIVFFGACAIYIGRKFFDDRIGLSIDDQGITEYTSGTSVGLIEWEDITEVAIVKISSTKLFIVYTNQSEKYIAKAKNTLSKRAMQANFKYYDSPLSINPNALKIKFRDLKQLLETELQKREIPFLDRIF